MACKYPHIKVELIGQNGNAFNLIGITEREMRRGGVLEADMNAFREEAMSGDYDHLLQTIMDYVTITVPSSEKK